MSIFDNDASLPGVHMDVSIDYGQTYDTSLFGTTDSEMVIGTAFNGPVGVPTPVYNPEHGSYIFGDVYDSTKKQEATLVAGIQDAWDRGCRTIYAVRVGGKELYKDYDFCVDNGYKLRVSSIFPTNKGKDIYFLYDGTHGQEEITFFKPIDRATIAEKRAGRVSSVTGGVLSTTIKLAQDRSISFNSKLVDLIKLVNGNASNNTFTLSIVNADGVDVTSSAEAYEIPVGVMYPGLYTIGRDMNMDGVVQKTEQHFCLLGDTTAVAPYSPFHEDYWRKLVVNTDVTKALPLYAKDVDALRSALAGTSITMTEAFDFLKTAGVIDRAWGKDTVDYEETNLSSFEMYKRLGSGYAITAHAEKRVNAKGDVLTPRIRETEYENAKRIQPVEDGIYSVLQDAEVKYRVLTCAFADQKIDGKLPRADEFKRAMAESFDVIQINDGVNGEDAMMAVELTPSVEKKDRKAAKAFSVKFVDLENDEAVLNEKPLADKAVMYKDVFEILPRVADVSALKEKSGKLKAFENGAKFIVGDRVFRYADGKLSEAAVSTVAGHRFIAKTGREYALFEADETGVVAQAASAPEIINVKGQKATTAQFVLGSAFDFVFVFKANGAALEPVGDFAGAVSSEPERTVIYAEQLPVGVNQIIVSSNAFPGMTIADFVEFWNNNKILSRLFTAEMTSDGEEHRDVFLDQASGDGYFARLFDEPAVGTKVATQSVEAASKKVSELTAADKAALAKGGISIDEMESDESVNVPAYEIPAHQTEDFQVLQADRRVDYDYDLYIPYRTTDNFARQLAQHCTQTEFKTTPTWGFIGCTRLLNTSLKAVADKVAELCAADFDLYGKTNYGRDILDKKNRPYPVGKNLNLVFTQYNVPIADQNYTYVSTGAAGYAGMVSTLPLDQSSTSQPIAVDSTAFNLTQSQCSALTAQGIVTLRRSFTKGIVVTDGITAAPAESAYRRLNASRIVGSVEDLIRASAEPFIGKQNHQANRNALHTAIKSAMDKLVGTLVENYTFTMNADPRILKFNKIEISYKIVPIYEIREVNNTIEVTDSLAAEA